MTPSEAIVRRNLTLGYVLLVSITLLALLANQQHLPVGIAWNRSDSLPVGFYWFTPTRQPLQYEDKVCFEYTAPDWAKARHYFPEGSLLCKKVLGLPGDRIVREGDLVRLCNDLHCRDVGRVVTQDSAGRPVPAIELPETIPVGYTFLGVPEAKMSFDSRYLGLISINDIQRTIHPLWVVE
jgi:Type IV secretory pathway, protease TraF